MKVRPMLGTFAINGIEFIESSESRALVEHRVPGLEGSYFQDMGTVPNTIVIWGTKHGDEQRDAFLEGIRELFNAGEPTTFVADINTATDLTEVLIEDLQVAEVAGSADTFRYHIKLCKYVEPPEPVTTGLLDDSILDDALSLTDALDLIDALGSTPNLGDPTRPLLQTLDGIQSATGGLDQVVSDLRNLFGAEETETGGDEGPGVGPVAAEETNGELASGIGAPEEAPAGESATAVEAGAGEMPPSLENLGIDPADPRIDQGTKSILQGMIEDPETAETASGLVRGINGGTLGGIHGSDSDEVLSLADIYGVEQSQLVPSGQDAALVLDPEAPLEAPPTIVLRSGEPDIRNDPSRLGAALEEVGRTFALFEQGEIGRCASTASAVQVPNLLPTSFCQVPAAVPGTPVGEVPEEEPEVIDPSVSDLQIDPGDPRIDVGAKFALQRMIKNPDMASDAARLIRGINGGALAGVYGDDLGAAVKVAHAHGTERWILVPKGEDAALVLDATAPLEAPPTVIFRGDTPDIRSTPTRIDPALQKASQTFDLFQKRVLGLCATNASAVPVSNLAPPSYCQIQGQLEVLATDENGEPVVEAFVHLLGPIIGDGKTNSEGIVRFDNILPGEYKITAEKERATGTTNLVVLPPLSGNADSPVSSSPSGEAPDKTVLAFDGGGTPTGVGGKAVIVLKPPPVGTRINNVRILALTFLSDHGVMHKASSKTVFEVISATKKVPHTTLLMDDGPATAAFVKPDWTPDMSSPNPISQTMKTNLKIQLDIEFDLVPGPQMQFQGLTSVTKDKFMEFVGQFNPPIILTGTKPVVHPVITSKNPLPDHITILDGGRADWVLHIDGQDFHPAHAALQTGPHKIFVTLGEPEGEMKVVIQISPQGERKIFLEAKDNKQVITDQRLEFSCHAANGSKTVKDAARAIFDHLKDVERVSYKGGFKWGPDMPTPNKTGVEPKPPLHNYLWLCNKGLAWGECHWIAAAFILAVKIIGVPEDMEVGLMFPWPRCINSKTTPDTPLTNFPYWLGLPGYRFQGRYQKQALPKDKERYFRTHEDEHGPSPDIKNPMFERIRFVDGAGKGNGFEAVARLGRTLYAIGEPNGILEANDTNFPGFSNLSTEEERLHASATLFFAAPGSNLNKGRWPLYFIDAKNIGKDNTSIDPDANKCQKPYPWVSGPHFRWES